MKFLTFQSEICQHTALCKGIAAGFDANTIVCCLRRSLLSES